LLETLRQFGHRRLVERNELDPVRRRHLEFYIARARDIAALREAGGEVDWNRVGRLDTDNLRAAFNYALSAGDVHRAVDLFYELHRFAVFQLQVGLFEWADQLADLHATHPEICTARYQVAMCRFQWQRGRLHDALRSAELASDLDDGQDPQLSADRAEAAFAPHWFLGDSHAAYQTAQAGIDCAVAANLTASHCRLLAMRAQAEMSLGDPNAEATVRHSLAIANIAGSELLRTTGLLTLGGLLVGRAPAEAARHLEELRDIADRHGELWHLHSAQRVHGVALTRLGQHAEAAAAFRASIDGFERSGQSSHVWLVISNVCQLLVQAGQQHEAAVLLAAYELQPDLPTEASTMRGQQRARQALAGALTDSQLGDAHRRAQQLDPDGVIAYAKSTLTFLTDNARATTG